MKKTERVSRIVAALVLAVAAATGAAPARADGAVVTIACGALGIELELCREGAATWSARTGNTALVVSMPDDTQERLDLYRQVLGAGSAHIDVYQVDVIWPGMLAEHFIDLAPYMDGAEANHFAALVANNTVGGALKAMPWFAEVGVLFYRRDLLDKHGRAVPATWAELGETARHIQAAERAAGDAGLWGFVFQGRSYEGLTCNAIEWIASHGGGTILAADGSVTIDDPAAARALETVAGWIGEIVPPEVLGFREEDARAAFQAGGAVFMRNWPYAWSLANAPGSLVYGNVGVAPLPAGGPEARPSPVLGGWQLAVSRYSANPAAAADLVRFLTSRAEQERRAIEAAYNPTIPSLYRNPDVLAAVPFFETLDAAIADPVVRPSAIARDRYGDVSRVFREAVHGVLSGRQDAAAALAGAAAELSDLTARGR